MHGATARIGAGFLALAAIWIGVYWFWEPSRAPDVTFSSEAESADTRQASPPTPVETDPPAHDPAHPRPEPVTPDAASPRAEGPGEGPLVIPPEFRDYTVRDGDTFSSIAQRVYGASRHSGAIAAANPFVSPSNLRKGQVLRIPLDPENVQGRPAEGAAAEPPEPELVEYKVVPGDTLSEIAQRFYGSLRYAEVIFHANRDVMSSMDDLQIGDVLRIPSRESVLGEDDL